MFPESWGAGWTNQEELLAVIAELMDQHQRDFARAYSTKGTSARKPLEIHRPGRQPRRRQPEPGETAEVLRGLGGLHVPAPRREEN